jgi:hypothetical protein
MDIDASQKGTAGSKAVNVFMTSGNTYSFLISRMYCRS